ncbi:MAG: type II toxin-antitoxin system Phd/YefM family antitoxin [Candidatus Binataceae bacterium]|nr:type II toxin-antitoxin system Phd/YefM family antitoxin [Candidatus Binataceae bacterium]
MHGVNVHQLKNNPSEALRKVKDAPLIVLKGDRPTATMLNLDDEALLKEPDVSAAHFGCIPNGDGPSLSFPISDGAKRAVSGRR